MTERQIYLVCYDYGTGGLWGYMAAESAQQIKAKYPELTLVAEHPGWMTSDQIEWMRKHESHQIEDVPWGILKALVSDREQLRLERESSSSSEPRSVGEGEIGADGDK